VSRFPEEVLVFGRLAAFGIIVGGAYWFVSYEPAGTVLLLGFGVATGVGAVLLWVNARHAGPAGRGSAEGGPFLNEPGRIPAPAFAPFHVGAGLGMVALGLAFGPLLVLTGVVIAVIGARYWLEAAMREADATEPPASGEPGLKDPIRTRR
jgi:hypothetical protein